MPELPEVETIRRGLANTIVGKKIGRVEIRWPGIVRGAGAKAFKRNTEEKCIVGTGRRGKYLLIHLSHGRSLILHLKMSGVLSFIKKGEHFHPSKHTHIIFHFTDGSRLLFSETRKFGFAENVTSDTLESYFAEKRLGPEPFDSSFSVSQFISRLRRHPKTTIKSALMNQQIIAGMGNIYADEVLYRARIRPKRKVMSLPERELRLLYMAVQKVLQTGIEKLGTTFRFYRTIFGERGGMADYLKVYGREGKLCQRCRRSVIKKIVIAGRSSHYCPYCQK